MSSFLPLEDILLKVTSQDLPRAWRFSNFSWQKSACARSTLVGPQIPFHVAPSMRLPLPPCETHRRTMATGLLLIFAIDELLAVAVESAKMPAPERAPEGLTQGALVGGKSRACSECAKSPGGKTDNPVVPALGQHGKNETSTRQRLLIHLTHRSQHQLSPNGLVGRPRSEPELTG
jgi:hypothetical protein